MKKSGFTLIELSIVLVIIGLIVGGVLVGRDLIKGAEVRATVSQVEKFKTAVNTFRLKYGGYLPGDIPPSVAVQYGLFAFTGPMINTFGYGDANGFVDTADANSGEVTALWRHLSETKLIAGSFGMDPSNPLITDTSSYLGGSPTNYPADPNKFYPQTKLANNYFFAGANVFPNTSTGANVNKRNYFVLWGVDSSISWTTEDDLPTNTGLSPIDAYALDVKIDDGLPNTGLVIANTSNWAIASVATNCIYSSTAYYRADVKYNTIPATGGNAKLCPMYIMF